MAEPIRIAPSGVKPLRIAMWSGPRNISTAMMRSFSSRADTSVTDEPFYGAFLRATGEPQPMAAEVIADMDCDWQSVADTVRGPAPDDKAIWYQKHMPHHMVGSVDILDFPDHAHAFLIRDPDLVVASYAAKKMICANPPCSALQSWLSITNAFPNCVAAQHQWSIAMIY